MVFTLQRSFMFTSLMAFISAPAFSAEVVNVYSYRQPTLVQPLFDVFTKETGIEVRMVFAENGLIERIAQEGRNSPADVLLTADVGRLVEASKRGLVQPVSSEAIKAAVPANLRDPENKWFGLTMRARVVYASRERVKVTSMSYEDLAKPEWKGKVCVRPGNHPYNLGLIAGMISHYGDAGAKTWLEGVKANLAIKPAGNDRAQAKSVFSGECDIAVANTYYLGLMLTNSKEPEQKEWAKAVRLIFPSSDKMGTNVNISGMAMMASAPDQANALKLMEFLASDRAQKLYAEGNFEYPVNPKVPASAIVQSWGSFTPDTTNLSTIANLEPQAARLVDETGFND